MEKDTLLHEIEEEIENLLELSSSYGEEEIGLHEIEREILDQLLKVGLAVLKNVIALKTKESSHYEVADNNGKSIGQKSRKYLSLFGKLDIARQGYWSKETGVYFTVDELLQLPSGTHWSYNIQELVGENSSETNFRESVRLLNELLGLKLSGKSSERNTERLGEYVEEFYDLNSYQDGEEGPHFMASFDGKGVSKKKPVSSERDNPKERLSRGEKRGVKQMATVSVTASFTPQQKTSESIIKGLMGTDKSEQSEKETDKKPEQTDNRMYKNIHRRGFLADQEKAIEYGIIDLKARMSNPESRFIIPIDAGIGLEDKILTYVEEYDLTDRFDGIVLDIVHVSEYVWDCATAIFGEKSKQKRPWVKSILTDLLEGKTDQVINELKLNRDKTNLTQNKKDQLSKTITYFSNHKHKMNYEWFLKKGYPISSAIVESTCKHLVKDRMEQSGMRWTSQGAQNMLDMRSVKINGDTKEFMDFVIQKDRKVNLTKIAA